MYDREYAKMCVGAGWHGLVDEAFDLVESHGSEVAQLKEKFGQMRVYINSTSDDLYNKVWEIESKSASICETCGAPSKLQNRGGWLKSICDPCLEEHHVQSKTST
jgi:hypothetical protein